MFSSIEENNDKKNQKKKDVKDKMLRKISKYVLTKLNIWQKSKKVNKQCNKVLHLSNLFLNDLYKHT